MGKFFPVTPYKGAIYSSNDDFFSKYYLTELTSFSGDGITRHWLTYDQKSFSYTSQSVAVDDQYVYFYRSYSQSGLQNALVVVDRATGNQVKEIPDTRNKYTSYDYDGAPIVSSPGHVVAYSDGQFLTTLTLEAYLHPRALIRYDIAAGTVSWISAEEYITTPAVNQGSIFAASNTTHRLDALDEASGQVRWSWTAPAGESFIRNTIVTKNLVFLSTDKAVYAIDRVTHQQVWTVASPGGLSIADAKYLLIASPGLLSYVANTLTAIRLN
jgi:outer membrane protein assembly factor BamB